jgi:hypothetical protein
MKDVHGFLIIYDDSDRSSFEALKKHSARFQSPADQISGLDQPDIAPLQDVHSKPPIILLVGSKSKTSNHAVTENEGRQLACTLGCKFKEMLAEDETSLENLLFEIVRIMRSLGKGIFTEKDSKKVSPREKWCGVGGWPEWR